MSAPGKVIGILGPDGVGKTTVIKGLTSHLHGQGLAVHYHHWQVRWCRPTSGHAARTVADPHGNPPYNTVVSLIKLVYLWIPAWPAWWRWVRPAVRRGDWVILDRGPDDLVCDPRRYRYGGPLWVARLWAACMPKAERIIVLTADPEIVLARKREVEPAELARQITAYQALRTSAHRQVDAAERPEQVVAAAWGLLS